MSISSVSSVSDSGQTSTANQITQYTDLGKNDFLKLICAQLKYQDPLSPVDNFDFLGQTAQFSMLEQVIDLNSRFDILAQLNDMAYVNSLLGKSVEWED